ncbi:MAG: hypothetical protein K1X74_01170 [Pirellulales bacterium]|nr:hypothetical protein [Pirellulales bacterium]
MREIGDRLEPFVDRWLIDRLDGVDHRLQHPVAASVALAFDRPWEGAFSGYVTILRDGERLRAYYRGLPASGQDGSPQEVTCVAESADGITWTKPELDLFPRPEAAQNNIVLANAAPATHNFAPFVDERPEVPAAERYKALGGTSPDGLWGFVSADGFRWRRLQDTPVFTDEGWVFDSQNVAFWSATENCYVLYYRKSVDGFRAIGRATSPDFLHWSAPVQMSQGDAPREHLYTNQTHAYFRAPHIYLGVAARFFPGRQVITPEEAAAIHVDPKYFGDISDAVLLTSRGGDRYDRTFLEAFVRPGPGLENWVSRTNYPARGIVPSGERELSLYVQKNYGQPTAHLLRYVLRTDGFAALHGSYTGGEVVTRPLRFATPATGPRRLVLNVSTSAAGSVRVELQDADGQPLAGYALDDCVELIGDDLEKTVAWKSGSDLQALAGQPVRLRLQIKDADVYALRFR